MIEQVTQPGYEAPATHARGLGMQREFGHRSTERIAAPSHPDRSPDHQLIPSQTVRHASPVL